MSVKLQCSAKDVFTGWLTDQTHSIFTGGASAKTSPHEGGLFSVWNNYISGENVEIFPYKKIIQKWRTTDFEEGDDDSLLEIFFTQKDDHTLVTITHSNIPDGFGERYRKGWKDFYFSHMKKLYDKK